jgi:hypothetical protein
VSSLKVKNMPQKAHQTDVAAKLNKQKAATVKTIDTESVLCLFGCAMSKCELLFLY